MLLQACNYEEHEIFCLKHFWGQLTAALYRTKTQMFETFYLDVYPLLWVHHSVVAHFQALEDLHVLDVQAGEVLEGFHDGGLWGRWRWLVTLGHV